ncbi:12886_t:CDS:2 [Funneliformis mosseae]|uniref:12886_t:CDS:1 n=1 Tax=Funneliformis mosseae TaxID=27381 RepID=A0A9N8VVT7_FUNMO|nr:12886_t:CDS:2 [Funneliformis mosseae]
MRLCKNLRSSLVRQYTTRNMARPISTTEAPGALGPYSQAIVANGFVFVSGQLPVVPATGNIISEDIKEQTTQAVTNLSNVLKAAKVDLSKVVKTTVYLKDMNDFPSVNEAYAKVFGDNRPARACVEVSRLPKDVKIEIDAIALTT